MSAPTSTFSRLSLDDMTPVTRSRSRRGAGSEEQPAGQGEPDHRSDPHSNSAASSKVGEEEEEEDEEDEAEEEGSDEGSDVEEEDEEEELERWDAPVVRSPAGLSYTIAHLPENVRVAIRGAFAEPPKLTLQRCRRIDSTYAFQMTQQLTHSVRIRAAREPGVAHLSCSCGQDQQPCEHLVWLLDQIVSQTLYDHDRRTTLTMTQLGYPAEAGDMFDRISRHRLDVLAQGLHCHLLSPEPELEDAVVDSVRLRDAREMLSCLHGVPPDDFRPDLFARPRPRPRRHRSIIKPRDLDATVLRMLLDNSPFFHYFASLFRPSDPIRNPFWRLARRVDHVLRDLDAHAAAVQDDDGEPHAEQVESPATVPWASTHILGCVRLVRRALYDRDAPLRPQESLSAARALVHILDAVAGRNFDAHDASSRLHRDLYLRLIGHRDSGFVIEDLDLLPWAASHFLHTLEAILDRIHVHGAPVPYVDRFRTLIARLRTRPPPLAPAGVKRYGQEDETDRWPKRMK